MATARFVTDIELSEELGISVHTLRADRQKKRRISFIKFGRSVRYDPNKARAEVQAFSIGGAQPATIPVPVKRRPSKGGTKRRSK
jgi:hypothetical protein